LITLAFFLHVFLDLGQFLLVQRLPFLLRDAAMLLQRLRNTW